MLCMQHIGLLCVKNILAFKNCAAWLFENKHEFLCCQFEASYPPPMFYHTEALLFLSGEQFFRLYWLYCYHCYIIQRHDYHFLIISLTQLCPCPAAAWLLSCKIRPFCLTSRKSLFLQRLQSTTASCMAISSNYCFNFNIDYNVQYHGFYYNLLRIHKTCKWTLKIMLSIKIPAFTIFVINRVRLRSDLCFSPTVCHLYSVLFIYLF